jgi:hypothetical protein
MSEPVSGIRARDELTDDKPATAADQDVDAVIRLADELSDRLLDLRGPSVHAVRLARALTLDVVDALDGLRASRNPPASHSTSRRGGVDAPVDAGDPSREAA